MTDIIINPDEIYWAFWRSKDAYNYGNVTFLMDFNLSEDLKRASITVQCYPTNIRGGKRMISGRMLVIRTTSWILSEYEGKTKKELMVIAIRNLINDNPSLFIHPVASKSNA